MKKGTYSFIIFILCVNISTAQIRTDSINKNTKGKIETDQSTRFGEEYKTDGFKQHNDFIEIHSSNSNGGEIISYYSPEGEWLESVKFIDFAELPKGVQKAFMNSTFSNEEIEAVYMVDIPNNQFFALNVEGEADDRFFFINPAGEEIDLEKKLMFITRIDELTILKE